MCCTTLLAFIKNEDAEENDIGLSAPSEEQGLSQVAKTFFNLTPDFAMVLRRFTA